MALDLTHHYNRNFVAGLLLVCHRSCQVLDRRRLRLLLVSEGAVVVFHVCERTRTDIA